jgi:hypothetical protein
MIVISKYLNMVRIFLKNGIFFNKKAIKATASTKRSSRPMVIRISDMGYSFEYDVFSL